MATAALVLGIIGLILSLIPFFFPGWLCAILAIIFGAIGRERANQGLPNGSWARAGLILGVIALVVAVAWIALLVAVFNGSHVEIHTGLVLPAVRAP